MIVQAEGLPSRIRSAPRWDLKRNVVRGRWILTRRGQPSKRSYDQSGLIWRLVLRNPPKRPHPLSYCQYKYWLKLHQSRSENKECWINLSRVWLISYIGAIHGFDLALLGAAQYFTNCRALISFIGWSVYNLWKPKLYSIRAENKYICYKFKLHFTKPWCMCLKALTNLHKAHKLIDDIDNIDNMIF